MVKKPASQGNPILSFRVSRELYAAIEAARVRLAAERPGIEVLPADVARETLGMALLGGTAARKLAAPKKAGSSPKTGSSPKKSAHTPKASALASKPPALGGRKGSPPRFVLAKPGAKKRTGSSSSK